MQAGVLPVVDEGQQLAGLGGQFGLGTSRRARTRLVDSTETAELRPSASRVTSLRSHGPGSLVADLAGQNVNGDGMNAAGAPDGDDAAGRSTPNPLGLVAHLLGRIIVGAHPRVGKASLGDRVGRPELVDTQVAVHRIAGGDVAGRAGA